VCGSLVSLESRSECCTHTVFHVCGSRRMEDENGTSRTKRRGWEGVGVYSQRQSRNAAIAREYDRIECSRARIGIGEEQKCREWREVPGGLEVLGSGPSSSSLNRNASTHTRAASIYACRAQENGAKSKSSGYKERPGRCPSSMSLES
jgi:hypothetical protein